MPDREKIISDFEKLVERLFHRYKIAYKGDAEDYYEDFLIADAALELLKKEPVNCSDCKHYGYNNMTNQDGFCYCIKHHEYPSPDFFCADGERR